MTLRWHAVRDARVPRPYYRGRWWRAIGPRVPERVPDRVRHPPRSPRSSCAHGEPRDLAGRGRRPLKEARIGLAGVGEVLLVDDRVPREHAPRAPAAEAHDDVLGDARAAEGARPRPSEVMEEDAGEPDRGGRGPPRAVRTTRSGARPGGRRRETQLRERPSVGGSR